MAATMVAAAGMVAATRVDLMGLAADTVVVEEAAVAVLAMGVAAEEDLVAAPHATEEVQQVYLLLYGCGVFFAPGLQQSE